MVVVVVGAVGAVAAVAAISVDNRLRRLVFRHLYRQFHRLSQQIIPTKEHCLSLLPYALTLDSFQSKSSCCLSQAGRYAEAHQDRSPCEP